MTEYLLDNVSQIELSSASLSQNSFIFSASPDASPEFRLVSYQSKTPSNVFASQPQDVATEIEFAENYELVQGYTEDADVGAHPSTILTSGNIVHWRNLQGLDVRNVVIARAGSGIQNSFWANASTVYFYEEQEKAEAPAVLISERVTDFCYRHQLSTSLQVALRQARYIFSPLQMLTVEVERDCDSEDEWVALLVQVRTDPEQMFEMYEAYTRASLESIPWPARDKIRLTYDLV